MNSAAPALSASEPVAGTPSAPIFSTSPWIFDSSISIAAEPTDSSR